MSKKSSRSRTALGVLAAFAWAAPALAYVPPSQFIVKKLADKRQGYKSVRIRSQFTAMEGEQAKGESFRAVTVADFTGHVLRTRIYSSSGSEVFSAERRLGAGPLPAALLLDNASGEIARALKAAGIPVRTEEDLASLQDDEARRRAEVSALSRWKSQIAWVIGVPKVDRKTATRPQLWVEKDQFLPIRLVLGPQEDYRFEAYRFVQEFPYPRTVTLATGGPDYKDLAFREELVELVVNAAEPAEMKAPVVAGFSDAGKALDGSSRELITRYVQSLR